MSRTRPLSCAVALLVAACGPDISHIDIDNLPTPKLAEVRMLLLTPDEPAFDAWVAVPGELPVAFNGVPSPGVTEWRKHPAGSATAVLSLHGRTLSSTGLSLLESARYTVVHFGRTAPGASPAATTLWLEESGAQAPENRALVRVLHGAPSWEVRSVSLIDPGDDDTTVDDTSLPLSEELLPGAVSTDVEVEATVGTIVVDDGSGVPLSFEGVSLEAGRRYTLALGDSGQGHPAELLVIDESESIGTAIPGKLPPAP